MTDATPKTQSNEVFLNSRQIRERYGDSSEMWITRRLNDASNFPKPVFISNRRFWALSALVRWEAGLPTAPRCDSADSE